MAFIDEMMVANGWYQWWFWCELRCKGFPTAGYDLPFGGMIKRWWRSQRSNPET